MSARYRVGLALCVSLSTALLGGGARGQESLDDIDKGATTPPPPPGDPSATAPVPGAPAPLPGEGKTSDGKAVAEVNGYIDNRLQFAWINSSGPIPTQDQPALQDLFEANIQLKVNLGMKIFAYADVSLFFQGGGFYYGACGATAVGLVPKCAAGMNLGTQVGVPDHDVAALAPLVVPAELYVSISPTHWLNLLVGKKRITWGSGFAFNPTDLINPPKDPTDPTFQRAGSWLARVEAPFEKFTVSALFSPTVLNSASGIPSAVMYYPSYPTGDDTPANVLSYKPPTTDAHYLLAARLYALVYDSDINLILYFSNRYRGDTDFQNKLRLGASFSRYFFTDWELHVEALLQTGTTRVYANPTAAAMGNLAEAFPQTNLNSGNIFPRLIVGTRRTFADESNLSIEYYYQGDGYSGDQFKQFMQLVVLAESFGINPLAVTQAQNTQNGGLPNKFSFDPLRRHYLIGSYSKPKIKDDFTATLSVILGMEDLSGLINPSVSWAAKEWLTLSLTGFIPFHNLGVNDTCVTMSAAGKCTLSVDEYSLLGQDWRVLFEVRAFY